MKIYLLILMACLGMISCKPGKAFDYSQSIVKIETDLAADLGVADKKVSYHLENNNNDSAAVYARQMEDMARQSLRKVEDLDMPDVAEAENFRREAIRYFSYITSIYESLNKLTSATNDTEVDAERQRLADIVSRKEQATNTLQAAQRKFAEANNFRIEK